MCRKRGHFDSYHFFPNRHSCNPCSFYPCLSELISPSYDPPSDYPEAYKTGWERAKREK